ncbi:MAG: ABC transporter substrate-binding protein [Planctomycetia bacterium]|nr:ABC transporter substrate-binding protein [Planctomycetia bacterium]
MSKKKVTIVVTVVAVTVIAIAAALLPKPGRLGPETRAPATQPQPEKLTFRLKWFIYSSFAHHLIAQEKGLYARENLNIDIRPGGANVDPIKSVIAGEDDIGLASYAQILLAREKGIPIIAIAEEYVKSGVVAYSLQESGIKEPKDFVGKKVGLIPASDTGTVYEALMAKQGIDRKGITEVTIGFDLTPLLTGAIDVSTVGYVSNQPIAVAQKGHAVNIIDPWNYGIRPGGNVVFTTEQKLREKRPQLKAFLRAMLEAISESQKMQDAEVVDIVLKLNPNLNRQTELEVWRVTKEQLLSHEPGKSGLMPEGTWKHTAEIFSASGVLKRVPDIESCYTNDLVREIHAERSAGK